MKYAVVATVKECKELWNTFSPHESLWDLFEVRKCFFNRNFTFHFIVGYENSTAIGILPLVYDKVYNNYYYFGDTFPEKNRLLIKDKKKSKSFLEKAPEGTYIHYIDATEASFYPYDHDESRYFLDLRKYGNSIDTYLASFKKKRRKNLRNELKKLEEKGYTLHTNRIDDYETLVTLNKKRFKDSDFKDKQFVESMRKLILVAKKNKWLSMISCEIDGVVEGVEIAIRYKDVYYVIAVGKNIAVKNIGKLLFLEHLKTALHHNISILDFCAQDAGWKERWHLESEPTYQFVKE